MCNSLCEHNNLAGFNDEESFTHADALKWAAHLYVGLNTAHNEDDHLRGQYQERESALFYCRRSHKAAMSAFLAMKFLYFYAITAS